MKKYATIALVAFAVFCVARCAAQLPQASVTIKVIDDEGHPVEGASVGVSFMLPYNAWSTPRTEYAKNHDGFSDKNGLFSATDGCKGDIGYGARKEGYYDSVGNRYDYKSLNALRTAWQPESPKLTAVLKKIINPVPMYVRKVGLEVPRLDEPLAFDLEVGDWIAPYGKGMMHDLVFTITHVRQAEDEYDASLTLSFPNPKDGVQAFESALMGGSLLKSAQFAPENGYEPKWVHVISAHPATGRIGWDMPATLNYVFRTRTILDENGKILKANYGEIYGFIRIGGFKMPKPKIVFTYYFNPDPQSRSLEFDSTRNLVSQEEHIYSP